MYTTYNYNPTRAHLQFTRAQKSSAQLHRVVVGDGVTLGLGQLVHARHAALHNGISIFWIVMAFPPALDKIFQFSSTILHKSLTAHRLKITMLA